MNVALFKKAAGKALLYGALLLFAAIALVPFCYMVATAMRLWPYAGISLSTT